MYDLALSEHGDLVFAANRDFLGVSGTDVIEQRIRTRLKIPRGSWVYDLDKKIGSRLHVVLNHDTERALAEIPVFVKEALDEIEDITINEVTIDDFVPSSYTGPPPLVGTNYVSNPSLELNQFGWSTFGTNVIARDTTKGFFGSSSLKFTIGNDLRMATFALPDLVSYACMSCYLWIDSSWNGGGLFPTDDGTYAGAQLVAQQLPNMALLNQWQRMYSVYKLDTDKTGAFYIRTSNLGGGGFAWIDGIQVEDAAIPSDYIDGDQPACKWTGNPHNSISQKYVYDRAEVEKSSSGRNINLVVKYSVNTPIEGAGAPSEPNEDELIISLPL